MPATRRCLTLLLLAAAAVGAWAGEPVARRRIRVGVAGLTHGHVHGLLGRADRDDIEIVGIAEPNRDLARRYAERHGFSPDIVFDDLRSMVERTQPEVVTAFGSTAEHIAVVEACAPRRIHVMVEKPLALSLAEARRMGALARAHGIHVLTNYETTWYGSHRRLHELVVREGAIGGIRKVVVHDGHPGPVAIGVEKEFLEWLTDPARDGGGAIMDFGCYGANLMTWLMKGERPRSVTAVTQQLQPEVYPRVDDEATIVLTYPRAQAILQASWNWPVGRKDMEVYGERGSVFALDAKRLRTRIGPAPEEEREAERPPAPADEPFAYLAAVVRGEVKPAPDELSALELNLVVMEILDAARQSARTGRTVTLEAPRGTRVSRGVLSSSR
jgi:predicted dehydrogenase